jgi:hypothetical protein
MINIAVHMRMTGLQVSNEDVDSRKTAAAALAAAWDKLRDPGLIIVKAAEIAGALGGEGTPSASLGAEVEGAVQSHGHASAFLQSERPLEVGICAGVAALNLIEPEPGTTGWHVADIFATALWSTLAFQAPLADAKREALRSEVLEAARARSVKSAELARQRTAVNDFGNFAIAPGEEPKVTTNFKEATSATIEALRRNAALDREELDFLWWAMLGHSRLLGRQLSALEETVRLVAAGIEAAQHLRRFPCEVHRDLVLRTLDADPELDLPGVLAAVGAGRSVLGDKFADGIVPRAPGAFPLLHALASGSTSADGAAIRRRASEWGGRALLEASLVRLQSIGPGGL